MRAAAIFAVITLHVAYNKWYDIDINSYSWNVFSFYGAISQWGVGLFTMISGALFLSKDIELTKIYSKYILRIATAFIFWSFIYALRYYTTSGDFFYALSNFIKGYSHLWFLFMIVGLYMIIPFLKKIAASDFLMKYFLVLSFIFAFIIPETVDIIMLFSERYGLFLKNYFDGFNMHFVMGFTSYFIFGYFLNKIEISKKAERIIYVLGASGFFASVLMSYAFSLIKNEVFASSSHTVNVLFEVMSVFVFFRLHYPKSERLIKIFRVLSQYAFGAYLVHTAVIAFFHKLIFNPLSFNPLFSVPVIAVMVFIISFAISAVLNHIPIVKKYIV